MRSYCTETSNARGALRVILSLLYPMLCVDSAIKTGGVIDRRMVLIHDPLGFAGRARGVNEVSEIGSISTTIGVDLGNARIVPVKLVQTQFLAAMRPDYRAMRTASVHRGASIFEHIFQAPRRTGRVYGHVCRTCLKYSSTSGPIPDSWSSCASRFARRLSSA